MSRHYAKKSLDLTVLRQLDPANHKSIVDLLSTPSQDNKVKTAPVYTGKPKVSSFGGEDEDDTTDDVKMDVDVDLQDENDDDSVAEDPEMTPMPTSGGIEALREKLHARMAALRRGGGSGAEPRDRDELLEERRRQRAAMRERRRKETKEKIKRAEEAKGKKEREKDKDKRDKGNPTKVLATISFFLVTF